MDTNGKYLTKDIKAYIHIIFFNFMVSFPVQNLLSWKTVLVLPHVI